MSCRTAFRTLFLTESWRTFPCNPSSFFVAFVFQKSPTPAPTLRRGCRIIRGRNYQFPRTRRTHLLNCSHIESPSSQDDHDQEPPQEAVLKAISEVSKTEGRVGQTTNVVIGGTVTDDATNEWLTLDQKVNSYPTVRGFTAIGTGGDDFVQAMVVAVETVLQQPIPEMNRHGITEKYEEALQKRGCGMGCPFPNLVPFKVNVPAPNLPCPVYSKPIFALRRPNIPKKRLIINQGQVKQKISSGGKYVSVNIGPVQVASSEQVQAVYNAMRRDDWMKYFL